MAWIFIPAHCFALPQEFHERKLGHVKDIKWILNFASTVKKEEHVRILQTTFVD